MLKSTAAIIFLGLSAVTMANAKTIVAHRGASAYLPEHTLEAKALAGARRHHDKRVSPLQHGVHDPLLAGAKGPEPEMALQCRFKVDVHQGKGVV